MADKKVDRYRTQRPLTPTQQAKSALSDQGTIDMAERTHEKDKSALLDKFRRREERWRLEQSLHDRETAGSTELPPGSTEGVGPPARKGSGEGGAG